MQYYKVSIVVWWLIHNMHAVQNFKQKLNIQISLDFEKVISAICKALVQLFFSTEKKSIFSNISISTTRCGAYSEWELFIEMLPMSVKAVWNKCHFQHVSTLDLALQIRYENLSKNSDYLQLSFALFYLYF